MTKGQAAVLRFIDRYVTEHGYSPTVREICREMGWSAPSTAHVKLVALHKQGRIAWNPGQPRTLRLISREVAT